MQQKLYTHSHVLHVEWAAPGRERGEATNHLAVIIAAMNRSQMATKSEWNMLPNQKSTEWKWTPRLPKVATNHNSRQERRPCQNLRVADETILKLCGMKTRIVAIWIGCSWLDQGGASAGDWVSQSSCSFRLCEGDMSSWFLEFTIGSREVTGIRD